MTHHYRSDRRYHLGSFRRFPGGLLTGLAHLTSRFFRAMTSRATQRLMGFVYTGGEDLLNNSETSPPSPTPLDLISLLLAPATYYWWVRYTQIWRDFRLRQRTRQCRWKKAFRRFEEEEAFFTTEQAHHRRTGALDRTGTVQQGAFMPLLNTTGQIRRLGTEPKTQGQIEEGDVF